MDEGRSAYRVMVEKPEGKGPLGKPRSRWEYNVKMNLQEVRCGGVEWIDLALDMNGWRDLMNAAMNLTFPLNFPLRISKSDCLMKY